MNLSDPATFARVYDEHAGAVYGAALRVLTNPAAAQDVVHDVFLRVWRDPAKFDARRGELGTYLRLMARSRAVDQWRSGQAAGRAAERLHVVAERAETRVEEHPAPRFERAEQRRAIRAVLDTLPAPQREAVVLAYWGGLTAEEIARRAGVPLGTAKSRIRLGLARMREELERPRGGERELAAAVADAA
jgi:RNA polymerase sigma-70 factor (ECF subfamily)